MGGGPEEVKDNGGTAPGAGGWALDRLPTLGPWPALSKEHNLV